jgi:hypothetical protein
MNKLISILCLICLFSEAKSEGLWASDIKKSYIIKENEKFFKKMTETKPDILAQLLKFKRSILERDIKYYYSIRTDSYKRVVTYEYFSNRLVKNENFPSEIYFSLEDSNFGKDKFTIRVHYIQTENPKIVYCNISDDDWQFNRGLGEWKFVGNKVSWGAPIVIEQK